MNFRILPHLLDLFSPPYGDGMQGEKTDYKTR